MPQGIHGVVLLDKPEGISSQTAVTIVKRVFHAEKAGHTGTLDPMATAPAPWLVLPDETPKATPPLPCEV